MKMNLKNAIILYQLDQKPNLVDFEKWLKEKGHEVPVECEKFPQPWTLGFTEESVFNPDYRNLFCGRIELWKDGDYPELERNVCLPEDIKDIFYEILERI